MRGTSVVLDNRLEISVQTHFFGFGSLSAVDRQECWTQLLLACLAEGKEGGKLRKQRLRAKRARGEEALRSHLCGGAHRGGDEHAKGFNSAGHRQGLGDFLTLN